MLSNELLWQIAMELDYESLLGLCRSNKTYEAFCRSDNFWRARIRQDFGPLYLAPKPKPPQWSYAKYYHGLYTFRNLLINIRDEALNIIFEGEDFPETDYDVNLILLDWLRTGWDVQKIYNYRDARLYITESLVRYVENYEFIYSYMSILFFNIFHFTLKRLYGQINDDSHFFDINMQG